MQMFFSNIRPGAWLVDWLPFLNYLPDALAPWRRQAVAVRNQIMPFYSVFYHGMRKRLREGTAPDCFVARLLDDSNASKPMSEEEHLHIIAELITAGTETTATTLQWFLKAAVLFPEPTKRAQDEIDSVVGSARLPSWEDRAALPYVTAYIAELHRWASATPLAFVHATSEADQYRDRNVPKATTVLVNTFAIHQNPHYYPDPKTFAPERFLKNIPATGTGTDPLTTHYAFSVGRRECPGRHVAEASLYILISRILWTFNVTGKPGAPPQPGYSAAFPVFGPARYQCVITPRSQVKAQFIRETYDNDRPKDMEDASVYDKQLGV